MISQSDTGPDWATALAFPPRARLIELLLAGPASAIELAERLAISVGAARYHLGRLERLGVVAPRPRAARRGTRPYRLTDPEAAALALEHAADFPRPAPRHDAQSSVRALVALGGALRASREALGVTVSALAYRAGLTPAVLERIESGQADPRLTVVIRLAQSMRLPLPDLLRDAGRRDPRWG